MFLPPFLDIRAVKNVISCKVRPPFFLFRNKRNNWNWNCSNSPRCSTVCCFSEIFDVACNKFFYDIEFVVDADNIDCIFFLTCSSCCIITPIQLHGPRIILSAWTWHYIILTSLLSRAVHPPLLLASWTSLLLCP